MAIACSDGMYKWTIRFYKLVQAHARVRSACGWKAGERNISSAELLSIHALTQLRGLSSCCEDMRDGCCAEDAREIVRNRVDDACVGGPFDGARGEHIPKGNMLLEEKRATRIVFDKRMVGQLE